MSMAATEHDADLQRYAEERHHYAAMAKRGEQGLKELVSGIGIKAACSSRVKEPDEVAKKLLRYSVQGKPSGLDSVTDIVGLRVVVTHPDDRPAVVKAINNLFPGATQDDKHAKLGQDRLGYAGIHWDVRLPCAQWPLTNCDAEAGCEIQLQSQSERLWADLVHGPIYKGFTDATSPLLLRRANLLAALCELVDHEFSAVYSQMTSERNNRPLSLLNMLEQQFNKLTQRVFDRELSLVVLENLSSLLEDQELPQISDTLAKFVETNDEKLRKLFDTYQASPENAPLLYQPEALLIFMLLDQSRRELVRKWVEKLPEPELRNLATVWGSPLPMAG